MRRYRNGWIKRALAICLLLQFAFVSLGLTQDQHAGHSTDSSKTKMEMYSVSPLSGCDDYHCLKCKSRDKCTIGVNCGMPDCGDAHAKVECHGLPVLYLRSSAGYSSCMDRGEEVVMELNRVMTLENPEQWGFVVKDGFHGPEVWLQRFGTSQGSIVVSITESDVIGYRYRSKVVQISHRADVIDKDLVANWWASLLQDHFDSMILGIPPSLTVHTHCGKPLLKAYEAAREQVPEGRIPMDVWREVFSTKLSPVDRDRLEAVAQIIPNNFTY